MNKEQGRRIRNYIQRQEKLGLSPNPITLHKYGDRTVTSVEGYRAYQRKYMRKWRRTTTNPYYACKTNPPENPSPADDGTTETGTEI